MNTVMRTGLGVVGGVVVAGGILFAVLSGSGPSSPAEPTAGAQGAKSSVSPTRAAAPAARKDPESTGDAGARVSAGGGAGQGAADPALVAQGAQLYKVHICFTCHSDDGSTRTGPSFAGIYGHAQELMDGSKVVVDDAYIRESLMSPGAKVAKGFLPTMPSYKGRLSDQEIDALIAFIKSLR